MSLEELSTVATQKLERFRQSNQPDKVEDPKVVIQIENLYVTVEQHFPEVVPHKDRLSKKALDMFFSGVIGLAISQIYEHRDEIAEILRKVILVLIEITRFQ